MSNTSNSINAISEVEERKNKINWKPLCKLGAISGVFGASIFWLTLFLNNNTSLDECQFIQYILLIFNIPTFILSTIIFGPLGDRVPFLFHGAQGTYQAIAKIILYVAAFISYFFIGMLIKYIKIKNKETKKL